MISKLIQYLVKGKWEYGTCATDPARWLVTFKRARRHRLSGQVQFILWRRGERQGDYTYTEDYWQAYDRSWWANFRVDTEKPATFTYQEVKNELCQACRMNIPDVWCDGKIYHFVDGARIPCSAQSWRRSGANFK